MSISTCKSKTKELCKSTEFAGNQPSWQAAIEDAKGRLKEARRKVSELENVIQVFEQRIKDGDPWPTSSTQN
jgi:hypothetical protein